MTSVPNHLRCESLLELCIYKPFGTSIIVAEYGLRRDSCFIVDTGRLSSDITRYNRKKRISEKKVE